MFKVPIPPTPGARVPLLVTVPPRVPVPLSVAPVATVTGDAVIDPVTLKVPALTSVAPV